MLSHHPLVPISHCILGELQTCTHTPGLVKLRRMMQGPQPASTPLLWEPQNILQAMLNSINEAFIS